MKNFLKKKKAILGMNTAQQFIIGILTLVILSVMVLVILAALQNTSLISSNAGAGAIINNTTAGLSALFGNAITWFVLLGLVIIILIIGVVIGVVRGFGDENSRGGDGSPRIAQI